MKGGDRMMSNQVKVGWRRANLTAGGSLKLVFTREMEGGLIFFVLNQNSGPVWVAGLN